MPAYTDEAQKETAAASQARDVKIEKTEFVEDRKTNPPDRFYQIYGRKNGALACFETRDEKIYTAAAACEDTDRLLTITFTRERRANKPVFVITGVA